MHVGLDLGWTTGATGAAAVDDSGRLVSLARVRTDDEIVAWLDGLPRPPQVVAVDAPLVVPNDEGMRVPERLMSTHFGRFGASAHVSNRKKFGGDSRAFVLARRLGWEVDPVVLPAPGRTCVIEVYPHPALVALFSLPYRLDYKKGNVERRRPGFLALIGHLESLAELETGGLRRWQELKRIAREPGPGDLDRIEDELDAVVCAHLAWLWGRRRSELRVYGSLADGYIVAPPPPGHRASRPAPHQGAPGAPVVVRAEVEGRPTGYAGGAHERAWKQAVRASVVGSVPADVRLRVEVAFRLRPDQAGRNEPDLDNLIKSTVDALVDVIGRRTGTGNREEADDVRVDQIVASKRFALDGESPGASVSVTPL